MPTENKATVISSNDISTASPQHPIVVVNVFEWVPMRSKVTVIPFVCRMWCQVVRHMDPHAAEAGLMLRHRVQQVPSWLLSDSHTRKLTLASSGLKWTPTRMWSADLLLQNLPARSLETLVLHAPEGAPIPASLVLGPLLRLSALTSVSLDVCHGVLPSLEACSVLKSLSHLCVREGPEDGDKGYLGPNTSSSNCTADTVLPSLLSLNALRALELHYTAPWGLVDRMPQVADLLSQEPAGQGAKPRVKGYRVRPSLLPHNLQTLRLGGAMWLDLTDGRTGVTDGWTNVTDARTDVTDKRADIGSNEQVPEGALKQADAGGDASSLLPASSLQQPNSNGTAADLRIIEEGLLQRDVDAATPPATPLQQDSTAVTAVPALSQQQPDDKAVTSSAEVVATPAAVNGPDEASGGADAHNRPEAADVRHEVTCPLPHLQIWEGQLTDIGLGTELMCYMTALRELHIDWLPGMENLLPNTLTHLHIRARWDPSIVCLPTLPSLRTLELEQCRVCWHMGSIRRLRRLSLKASELLVNTGHVTAADSGSDTDDFDVGSKPGLQNGVLMCPTGLQGACAGSKDPDGVVVVMTQDPCCVVQLGPQDPDTVSATTLQGLDGSAAGVWYRRPECDTKGPWALLHLSVTYTGSVGLPHPGLELVLGRGPAREVAVQLCTLLHRAKGLRSFRCDSKMLDVSDALAARLLALRYLSQLHCRITSFRRKHLLQLLLRVRPASVLFRAELWENWSTQQLVAALHHVTCLDLADDDISRGHLSLGGSVRWPLGLIPPNLQCLTFGQNRTPHIIIPLSSSAELCVEFRKPQSSLHIGKEQDLCCLFSLAMHGPKEGSNVLRQLDYMMVPPEDWKLAQETLMLIARCACECRGPYDRRSPCRPLPAWLYTWAAHIPVGPLAPLRCSVVVRLQRPRPPPRRLTEAPGQHTGAQGAPHNQRHGYEHVDRAPGSTMWAAAYGKPSIRESAQLQAGMMPGMPPALQEGGRQKLLACDGHDAAAERRRARVLRAISRKKAQQGA